MSSEETIRALSGRLGDIEIHVRQTAAWSLVQLRSARAIPLLIDYLPQQAGAEDVLAVAACRVRRAARHRRSDRSRLGCADHRRNTAGHPFAARVVPDCCARSTLGHVRTPRLVDSKAAIHTLEGLRQGRLPPPVP